MSTLAAGPQRTATDILDTHVAGVVTKLQLAYLSDHQSLSGPAAAQLARLRRGVSGAPGDDPLVWQLMFENWPVELTARDDAVTRAESAAHAALSLYAIHQQSERSHRMHISGVSLGRAIARLARPLGDEEEQRVRRRFNALATGATLSEILHHARGLITQLRGEDIPLDYGRLAADLFLLQSVAHADRVRRRWGRAYYAVPPSRPDASGSETPAQTTTRGDHK